MSQLISVVVALGIIFILVVIGNRWAAQSLERSYTQARDRAIAALDATYGAYDDLDAEARLRYQAERAAIVRSFYDHLLHTGER